MNFPCISSKNGCPFEQQPEGKAMLKSKFCREFKEMKENNFTIVQLMIAEAVHVDV